MSFVYGTVVTAWPLEELTWLVHLMNVDTAPVRDARKSHDKSPIL